MVRVKYTERHFIDKYKCIDYEKELKAQSYWKSGGLYYFRLNEFNHKTLGDDEIISLEEF